MPYAVAHVILTIVIADIYRDYFAKKKFPMIYVLMAGIAGLVPDLDIPFSQLMNFLFGTNYNFHRIYTHSLLYTIIFFALALLFIFIKKEYYKIFKSKIPKRAIIMFLFSISFGWFIHIALDCTFAADGYLNFIPSIPLTFCPHPFSNDFLLGFDAIILVLWLIHEQWKHDIKDYI
ncbi:MAG TPA: metal-dependent hydrolase [Candidatus Nanoarchaeia archaeon]|nr:metal-dependent hydrolase [Candidatus Nanoarchaeia archaeon]